MQFQKLESKIFPRIFSKFLNWYYRPSTKAQITKLQDMVVADVIETLENSNSDLYNKAGGKKAIEEFITKETVNVVKKLLDNKK